MKEITLLINITTLFIALCTVWMESYQYLLIWWVWIWWIFSCTVPLLCAFTSVSLVSPFVDGLQLVIELNWTIYISDLTWFQQLWSTVDEIEWIVGVILWCYLYCVVCAVCCCTCLRLILIFLSQNKVYVVNKLSSNLRTELQAIFCTDVIDPVMDRLMGEFQMIWFKLFIFHQMCEVRW